MKNHLLITFFILCALFLCSCISPGTKAPEANAAVSGRYLDSLRYNGETLYLEQIDSAEYFKLPAPETAKNKTGNGGGIYYRDSIVRYDNSGLVDTIKIITLRLNNGDSVKYHSSMRTYLTTYSAVAQMTELNCYILSGNDGDGDFFMLVNKNTGQELLKSGTNDGITPVVSPDHKLFCYYDRPCNGIVPAGTWCTSLFVYSMMADTIHLRLECDGFKWKPYLKWKDSQTLYMKIIHKVGDGKGNDILGDTYFAKLSLPVFKR